jgi:hypothetical protein
MAKKQIPNIDQVEQEILGIAAVTKETFAQVAENIGDTFKRILDGAKGANRLLGDDILRNIKANFKTSSDLLSNYDKINQGLLKQSHIKKQIQDRTNKIRQIQTSINALKIKANTGDQEAANLLQNINRDYNELKRSNKDYIIQLNDQILLLDKIDKEVGLLGSGIEGIGKFLKGLGFEAISRPISKAIEDTKKYKSQLILSKNELEFINKKLKNRSRLSVQEIAYLETERQNLKEIIASLSIKQSKYRNLSIELKNQITSTNLIDGLILKTAKSLLDINKQQTEYRRITGQSVELIKTLNTGMTTTIDYMKQLVSLSEMFGVNAQSVFPSSTITEVTEMVELMGLNNKEAASFAKISTFTGTDLRKNNENLVKQINTFKQLNKVGVNHRQIFKDIASTSSATSISLGGSQKRIAEAALEARKLGLELKQIESISSSIIDFQSSIEAELEAELLTGKQLNLEMARYYALNNDLAGVTQELGKNQEIISEFLTGNRIQQESIAKAMGLSRDEMANMLYQNRIMLNISDEQLEKSTSIELSDMKRLEIQQAINNSISKMSEALAGPLELLASMLTNATAMKVIMVATGTYIAGSLVNNLGKAVKTLKYMRGLAISTTVAKAWGAAATGGLIGLLAGGALVAGIMASIKKSETPGLAKGGTVLGEGSVMVGEEGPEILSLKPGATVTPLSKTNAATENNGMDVKILVDELREMRNILIKILNKEGNIFLDSTKMGTAQTISTYKI